MIYLEKEINNIKKQDIRIIGLDLDGTVYTSDKIITPHTKEVLERASQKGILIIPTTGRAGTGIPDYLKTLKGMRYIVISNGASIIDLETGTAIYNNCIPVKDSLKLLQFAEQYHTFFEIYMKGAGWCEARFYDHMEHYQIPGPVQGIIRKSMGRLEEGVDIHSFVKQKNSPIEKIYMYFGDNTLRQKAMEDFKKYSNIKVTSSIPNNLEINAASCNKGEALLGLGKILGIRPAQIMTCGDGDNDLEMIAMAGHGVAMGNAVDSVKKCAKYLTKTNDEEGVAFAIEQLCAL